MTLIEKILTSNGPMLSDDLIAILADERMASPEAIRKQISRAGIEIKRKSGFFANNQFFYYLERHDKTPEYYGALLAAIKKSAKRLYSVIHALILNKGFLKEEEVANYSISPIKELKGHKRFDAIILQLIELELLEFDKVSKIYSLNKSIFDPEDINPNKNKGIEVARGFILNQFVDWAKMLGFVSFDSGQINGEFAKFQWNYTAPSYVGTFAGQGTNGPVPGFFVADLIIRDKSSLDDVSFFLDKVATVKAVGSFPRFIPMIIVDSVSEEALQALKKSGVVIGFLDKLFGRGYTNMLRDLVNTVTNAGAILKNNPEHFVELLKKIDALVDGKTNNLRGDLFEMTVGYYHGKKAQNIDVGKKIQIDGLFRELDVKAVYADKVVVAECKAYKSQMTVEEVQNWIEKVKLIRKWLSSIETYDQKRYVFELWALDGFHIDAIPYLESEAKAKKYDFYYYGRKEITEIARDSDTKFLQILKDYFIKLPV